MEYVDNCETVSLRPFHKRNWYPGCECCYQLWLPQTGRNVPSPYWKIWWVCTSRILSQWKFLLKLFPETSGVVIQGASDTWALPSTSSLTMIASTWKGSRSSWEPRSNPSRASSTRACMWPNITVRAVKKSSHELVSTAHDLSGDWWSHVNNTLLPLCR